MVSRHTARLLDRSAINEEHPPSLSLLSRTPLDIGKRRPVVIKCMAQPGNSPKPLKGTILQHAQITKGVISG